MILLWNSRQSVRLLAGVAAGAFVFAATACVREAFSSDSARIESAHQDTRAPAGSHKKSPANHDHDPCCATLRTVVTQHPGLLLAGASQPLLQRIPLPSAYLIRSVDLSFAPSGLSPPAREPIPVRLFYRTTFASHAPPAFLA